MKTIKLILAATLTAAMLAGCGCSNDNSDVTPSPTGSPMTDMQQNGNTADTAKSGAQDMGDAANDLTQGAGNAVRDAVDGVENAVGNMTGNN